MLRKDLVPQVTPNLHELCGLHNFLQPSYGLILPSFIPPHSNELGNSSQVLFAIWKTYVQLSIVLDC